MVKRIAQMRFDHTFLNLAYVQFDEHASSWNCSSRKDDLCTILSRHASESFGNELVHFQRSVIFHVPPAQLILLAHSNPTTQAPVRCPR